MNIVSYWTWWFSQCRHWGWPRSGEHGEHQRVLLGYQYLFQWTPNIFTSLLDMITQIYIHSFTITTVYNSLSCIHSFILIIQPSYNIHIANNHDNVYIHISIFIFIYIYHSLYIYMTSTVGGPPVPSVFVWLQGWLPRLRVMREKQTCRLSNTNTTEVDVICAHTLKTTTAATTTTTASKNNNKKTQHTVVLELE